MNIKSLLIGSAAALAVVSGAKAADAVVAAEPEPMEYVRVCDAYGTGFFYIPGTETCLKIGGKVRFDKTYTKYTGRDIDGIRKGGNYSWHTRAVVEFEAKNDSEWGPVYSWIHFQADHTNNSSTSFSAQYYAGIGGLEFGRFDSPGIRFHGYTSNTINDGYYASEWDRQYVSYTANFDSLSAFVAITNDLVNGSNYNYGVDTNGDLIVDHVIRNQNASDNGRTYMPDLSAGVKGKFGDYEVGVLVNYDESDESFDIRKWVRGEMGMFSFGALLQYSNSQYNSFFEYDGFSGMVWASAQVTDTVSLNKMVQWFDNDTWQIAANVKWNVAPGFVATFEGNYGKGGWLESSANGQPLDGFGKNHTFKAVRLRLDRNF